MKYRNTGAPIPLDNGKFIDTDVVFEPTPDQVRRLAYKLVLVDEPSAPPARKKIEKGDQDA